MPGWKLSFFDGAHDGWSCAKFPGNDISCNTVHVRYIKNRKAWSKKNQTKKGLPVHCPSNSGRFQGTIRDPNVTFFRCFSLVVSDCAKEISSPVLVKSQWIWSQRQSISDPKVFPAKNGEGSDSSCGFLVSKVYIAGLWKMWKTHGF